jgi:hypothetical protein
VLIDCFDDHKIPPLDPRFVDNAILA